MLAKNTAPTINKSVNANAAYFDRYFKQKGAIIPPTDKKEPEIVYTMVIVDIVVVLSLELKYEAKYGAMLPMV